MMTVQEWQWERNRSINRKTKQSGKGDVSQKGRDSGQGWKNGSWLETVRKPRLALGFPKASRLQWRSSQVPDTQVSWVSEIWTPTSLSHCPWGQGAPDLLSRRRLELTTWEKRNRGHSGLRLQALLREQVPHWGQGLCESPRTEQRMSPGPSCSQLHDAGSQRHPLSALQPAAAIPRRPQSLEEKTKLQTLTVRCPAGHSPDWSHSIKPQTSSPVSTYRDSSLLFSDSSLDVSGQQGLSRKDRFKTKVQKGIRRRQGYEISKKHSFTL